MNGYVITNENRSFFVSQNANGTYFLTSSVDEAFIFDSKMIADRVFKSNLSKGMKENGLAVRSVALSITKASPKVRPMKKAEQPEKTEATPEVDASKYIVSVIADAVAKLNSRHEVLCEELSKYDRQRTDIEHYIEFNVGKLSACEGYKAYKLLQDVLLKRRKIKDELLVIDATRGRIALPEELANIESEIQKLEERRYIPREFKHLFEK